MSFKIKRESKILKSLIIGLALLLISWGGVELTLRPGFGHTSSNSHSHHGGGVDWLLDGIDNTNTGWTSKSHVNGGYNDRVSGETPYLMVGNDKDGTYGFFDPELYLSLWVPDNNSSVIVQAYELCHNGWDGHISNGEHTDVYIKGGNREEILIEGPKASKGNPFCNRDQYDNRTISRSADGNKLVYNGTTLDPLTSDTRTFNIGGSSQKYLKYELVVRAKQVIGGTESTMTRSSSKYYSLFKLKTRNASSHPLAPRTYLTHNGEYINQSSAESFTTAAFETDDQENNRGIGLSHAIPGLWGGNNGGFQLSKWKTSFITATPSDIDKPGVLDLVGLYDGDRNWGGGIIRAKIEYKQRDGYPAGNWQTASRGNLTFQGGLTNSDKVNGNWPHPNNILGIKIQEILDGNNTSQLNGQRIFNPAAGVTLDRNQWENFLFYFEKDKVYRITFENITSHNYVSFKVPFEYMDVWDTPQLVEGKVKIAKDNGKCYLYIHYLEHITGILSERFNEIQLKIKYSNGNVLPKIDNKNIGSIWVDQKSDLDEDPFIYDDHKGSALKSPDTFIPGEQKKDTHRVIAEISNADLKNLEDIKITAEKHRSQSGEGDYENAGDIKFESLPEGVDCGDNGGTVVLTKHTNGLCYLYIKYLKYGSNDSKNLKLEISYKDEEINRFIQVDNNQISGHDFWNQYNDLSVDFNPTNSSHRNRIITVLNGTQINLTDNTNINFDKNDSDSLEFTIKNTQVKGSNPFTKALDVSFENNDDISGSDCLLGEVDYDTKTDTCRIFFRYLNVPVNNLPATVKIQVLKGSTPKIEHSSSGQKITYKDGTSRNIINSSYPHLLEKPKPKVLDKNTIFGLTNPLRPTTQTTSLVQDEWLENVDSYVFKVIKYAKNGSWITPTREIKIPASTKFKNSLKDIYRKVRGGDDNPCDTNSSLTVDFKIHNNQCYVFIKEFDLSDLKFSPQTDFKIQIYSDNGTGKLNLLPQITYADNSSLKIPFKTKYKQTVAGDDPTEANTLFTFKNNEVLAKKVWHDRGLTIKNDDEDKGYIFRLNYYYNKDGHTQTLNNYNDDIIASYLDFSYGAGWNNFPASYEDLKQACTSAYGLVDVDIDPTSKYKCRLFFQYLNTTIKGVNRTATVKIYKPDKKTLLIGKTNPKVTYKDGSSKGLLKDTFRTLPKSSKANDNNSLFALTNPALPTKETKPKLATDKWFTYYNDNNVYTVIMTLTYSQGGQTKTLKLPIPTVANFAAKMTTLQNNKDQICSPPNVYNLGYEDCRLFIKDLSLTIFDKDLSNQRPNLALQIWTSSSQHHRIIYDDTANTDRPLPFKASGRYSQTSAGLSPTANNTLISLANAPLPPLTKDTVPAKDVWFNRINGRTLQVRIIGYYVGSSLRRLQSGGSNTYLTFNYPQGFPTADVTECQAPPDQEHCDINSGSDASDYIKRNLPTSPRQSYSPSSPTYSSSPGYMIEGNPWTSTGHHPYTQVRRRQCFQTTPYCASGARYAVWRNGRLTCSSGRLVPAETICNDYWEHGHAGHSISYTTLRGDYGYSRTGSVNINYSTFDAIDEHNIKQILRLKHGDNFQSLDSQALISLQNNRNPQTGYAGILTYLDTNTRDGLDLVNTRGSIIISFPGTSSRILTNSDISDQLTITVNRVQKLGGPSLSASSSGGTLTAFDTSRDATPGINTYKWDLKWTLTITERFAWGYRDFVPNSPPGIHTTYVGSTSRPWRSHTISRTTTYGGTWSVCTRSLVVKPPTCEVLGNNSGATDFRQETFDPHRVGGSHTQTHYTYPVGINNDFTKFKIKNTNRIGITAGANYSLQSTTGAYAPGPHRPYSGTAIRSPISPGSYNLLSQGAHTMNLPGKYKVDWRPNWQVNKAHQSWDAKTPNWEGLAPSSTVCTDLPQTAPNTYTGHFYIYADPPTCRVEYTVFEVFDDQTRITVTLNNPNAVPMEIDRLAYSIVRGADSESQAVLNKEGNAQQIPANGSVDLRSQRTKKLQTGEFRFEWTIRTSIGNEDWTTNDDNTGQDSWFENQNERIWHEGDKNCQQTLRIVRRPYLKTFYGGLIVGGNYGSRQTSDSCSAYGSVLTIDDQRGEETSGFVYAHSTINPGNPKGSSAQFHVQVYDEIAGFYSANLRDNQPKPFKGLTMGQQGTFGGNFNSKKQCLANLWQRIDDSTPKTYDALDLRDLDPNNDDDDKRVYIKPDSGTLTLSSGGGNSLGTLRTTLYVDGDIIINQNIKNNEDPKWTDYKDIGYITIIAKGNIYIHPNVTRIDAFLVAYPLIDDLGDKTVYKEKGEVFTCKEGPSSTFNPTSHFNSHCNQPLTINGAIYAQKLRPGRIAKSVLQALTHPGDSPKHSRASEMILLLPEYIIGIPELPNFTDEDFLVDAIFVGAPPF